MSQEDVGGWFFDRCRSPTSPSSTRRGHASPLFSLVPDHNEPRSLYRVPSNPITPSASPIPAEWRAARESRCNSPLGFFNRIASCSTPSLVVRSPSPLVPIVTSAENSVIGSRQKLLATSAANLRKNDLYCTEPKSTTSSRSGSSNCGTWKRETSPSKTNNNSSQRTTPVAGEVTRQKVEQANAKSTTTARTANSTTSQQQQERTTTTTRRRPLSNSVASAARSPEPGQQADKGRKSPKISQSPQPLQQYLRVSSRSPSPGKKNKMDWNSPRAGTRSGTDVTSTLPATAVRAGSPKSSQNRILIKGGKVVNDDSIIDSDVFIEEGIIRQVGPNLIVPGGCRTFDARGSYVIPGGIDPHTHCQFPFMGTRTVDDFYSGTKAALAGGTTTIIDFVIATDVGLLEGYDRWRSWADSRVCCDYGLHVAVTSWKDGVTDKEIEVLTRDRGVNSFKCFMAYKDTLMLKDSELVKVFDVCKRVGALPMVHAENGEAIDYLTKKLLKMGVTGPEGHLQSRPEEVEAEATHRAIVLAESVGAPIYVVHVMSKAASDEVARAKARGCVVFGEALAAGIGSDGTHYYNRCWRHAAGHVLSPPLRADKTTPDHLINLVSAGLLDTTGSDHCVFSAQQKAVGEKDFSKIPNGVNGVEERMAIVWEKGVKTGKMTPSQFVAATSSNAARIFNIYPRKGKIAPGSDADIVIWGRKPQIISAEKHNSAADFNIFEGTATEFNPIVVISNGRVCLDEDGLHVIQGIGRFIPTPPLAPHIYSRIHARDLNMGPMKVDRSGVVEPKQPVQAGGATRNGAATPKKSAPITDLQLDIKLPETQGDDPGNTSPRSSTGSMTPNAFHKIHTKSGVRNQQDSGFKITGEQIDDAQGNRASIKVNNPPGGKSSGLW